MAADSSPGIPIRQRIADVVRGLAADAVQKAQSGHPGMPLGCAEIGSALFCDALDYDPAHPDWPDRDRFVLSAGHGCMWLYAFLHLAGFEVPLEELKQFRQLGSITPGHPEHHLTPGVEATTGPLGQGFANAVGMAITERMLANTYNTGTFDPVDHHTYCLAGDGDMMEGIVSEAASLAGHLGLHKLITIYDDNDSSIAGHTDLTFTESVPARFEAFDWHVTHVDGHDIGAIRGALREARGARSRPSLIVARTRIARGAPTLEGDSAAHGAPLGEEEIRTMKRDRGLPPEETFWVPDEVRSFFEQQRPERRRKQEAWQDRFEQWAEAHPRLKERWDRAHGDPAPDAFDWSLEDLDLDTPCATRDAGGEVLREVFDRVPHLVGGSADLETSNRSFHPEFGELDRDNYTGRNIHFGVREHAMGALANGIALHRGLRPFCATLLIFTDYMRPPMRLAALSNLPVIYVLTHDSIFLGEDGPTHQPVEHLETFRSTPNFSLFRPADARETVIAWQEALKNTSGPTALVLSRQSLPELTRENGIENARRGGYVVKTGGEPPPDYVLIGSGSEVSLAVQVAERLDERGASARVVSVPERDRFFSQDAEFRQRVLGPTRCHRVVLEAAAPGGWHMILGPGDDLFGVETFGASGPGEQVGRKYGFDPDAVLEQITS